MARKNHVEQVLRNKSDAIDEASKAALGEGESDGGAAAAISASPATRQERIRLAAYAAAERRGFAPGAEIDDWLEAEREVDSAGGAEVPPARP